MGDFSFYFLMHFFTRKSAGTPTMDLEFGREVAFPFVSSLLGNFARICRPRYAASFVLRRAQERARGQSFRVRQRLRRVHQVRAAAQRAQAISCSDHQLSRNTNTSQPTHSRRPRESIGSAEAPPVRVAPRVDGLNGAHAIPLKTPFCQC